MTPWAIAGLTEGGGLQGVYLGNREFGTARIDTNSVQEPNVRKGRSAFGDLTNYGSQDKHGAAEKGHQKSQNGVFALLDSEEVEGGNSQGEMEVEPTPDPFVDIDKLDARNPQACAQVANDIVENLLKAEALKSPSCNYMKDVQTEITPEMRSILVDWLVEVAQEYKLVSETLYLCISYVDRYLSCAPVERNNLQLVGVTCMLLASKYEEIYPPQVEEFCFITENTYTRKEILSAEREILAALKFELTAPTIRAFLRRFVKAAAASYPGGTPDSRLDVLSSYLAELSLLDYEALQFLPSEIAASAVLLAQYSLSNAPWNATLQHYTTYSASEIRSCVMFLHGIYLRARANSLPAICDKYDSPKYSCISRSNPPANLPFSLFQ